jgi:DNA topoisomerase VI subunit B
MIKMKKSLLFLLCFSLFTYSVVAQENEPENTISSLPEGAGMMISQLKAQLKTQLKSQLETQLVTELQSKSEKELNLAIDSMLLELDDVIEQANNNSTDSLALIKSFMKNFNFSVNEQVPDGGELFEMDELLKFHDTFYAEIVLMRDNLKSIRKIRNKDKKIQQLSGTVQNFFNESGFWDLMEMMIDKAMSFTPNFSGRESD